MLAITPLDIRIFITWMGLAPIFSASSRTVMLDGISIFVSSFSLIGHLMMNAVQCSACRAMSESWAGAW
jgi:hypothetical protein